MSNDGKQLTAGQSVSSIAAWLDNETYSRQITAALSGYMDAETFKAQCLLAIRDPAIGACSRESLFAAFLVCAQMNLLPGKHHSHVALIPRSGQVDVMPQWQGFLALMRRQAGVVDVRIELVHTSDEFAYDVENNTVTHRYAGDGLADREFDYPRGKDASTGLRGGYLRVKFADGRTVYHIVSGAKILRNMACAQSKNIWEKWFPEMCRKTIVRDAWAKRVIEIDPELEERVSVAAAADDVTLGNQPQPIPEKPQTRLVAVMQPEAQIAPQKPAEQSEPQDTPEGAKLSAAAKAETPASIPSPKRAEVSKAKPDDGPGF